MMSWTRKMWREVTWADEGPGVCRTWLWTGWPVEVAQAEQLVFTVPCSGQCVKGFPCTKAFNPHHSPMSHITIIFSLFLT